METNLKSVWLLSKSYTARVERHGMSGGNIINISSLTDRRTIKGQFPYAVSKGALTRLTEVMALEAARYNIRVNALAPGYFLTDVSRVLVESPAAPEFIKGIPMRRLGEFPDLDGPLLLLASDASAYMTGSVVLIDGGHATASFPHVTHKKDHPMEDVTPFTIEIADEAVADLKRRLKNTRFPDAETPDDWSQGIPLAYVKEVCAYWADEYDMAAHRRAHQPVRSVQDRDRWRRHSFPARAFPRGKRETADHDPRLAGVGRRVPKGHRAAG